MKKTIKRIVTVLLAMAAIAGAAWFLLSRDNGVSMTEEVARRQDIETYYTFTGNVSARGEELVIARGSGEVDEWHFEEGDTVKKNDVIVTYVHNTRVKAPADGTLAEIYVRAGEEFAPGTTVCRIADHSKPQVIFRVDEYDVHALRRGMECTVRILATGQEMTGTVSRIAVEGTVVGNLAYYDVELALPQDDTVRIGMSCEIIVPRERAKNAVTVSMDAIQYDENGKPFVYRSDREGNLTHTTVFLGINDGQRIEIREGLYEGETILVPPSFGFDPMAMRRQMMGVE